MGVAEDSRVGEDHQGGNSARQCRGRHRSQRSQKRHFHPHSRHHYGVVVGTSKPHYTFETVALLRQQLEGWKEDVVSSRCENALEKNSPQCEDFNTYLIEVNLDALPDQRERRKLKALPTSFRLKEAEVDSLRDAARRIVRASPEFQRLLRDL